MDIRIFNILILFLGTSFCILAQEKNAAYIPIKEDFRIAQQKYAKLPFPREADVAWQKYIWRKVEFVEKFNQYLYYPISLDEENGRMSLIALLWNALSDGKIKAYHDEDFKYELNFQRYKNKKERSDTIRIQISDEQGVELDTFFVSRSAFAPEEVKRLEIKEVWYIDKQRSGQEVRILGICLLSDVTQYDAFFDDFVVKGEEVLFWINYNEPETRKILATAPAFNEYNDADRISYDDVFIQRIFNSYIVKESNIQSRYNQSYLTGFDALQKAEEIRNEIMTKELDLWEY